jgi:16S rRNA (guanine(966)-N(2))-methyltransferase RsmD
MSELRILGGSAKGRKLKIPDSARPTGARVKKSLFDILSIFAPGSSFLDLYAGAGGVGLEAASRGFKVVMVELNPKAAETLDRNRRAIELEAKVLKADARKFIGSNKDSFDVVFIDPPYAHDILEVSKLALAQAKLVNDAGVLIVQHPVQLELIAVDHFVLERRQYGSYVLTFYWKQTQEES